MVPQPLTNTAFLTPMSQHILKLTCFMVPKVAPVALASLQVDSTLTGFTDVKPVNLGSQIDKQLRHSSV